MADAGKETLSTTIRPRPAMRPRACHRMPIRAATAQYRIPRPISQVQTLFTIKPGQARTVDLTIIPSETAAQEP
jgi:hypothetical protein